MTQKDELKEFLGLASTGGEQQEADTPQTESDSDADEVDDEEDAADEATDDEDVDAPVSFTGDYVTAEHLETWTITEYMNGDGTTMLVEGVDYTGLTGLTITNSDGAGVLRMEAVYGIGGMAACMEYYEFDDSDAAYYAEVVTLSAVEDVVPSVVDLTSSDYSEYTLFGKSVRRVDTVLYWDTTAGSDTFDAACGISHGVWSIAAPNFVAYGDDSGSYQLTLAPGASEADLVILDDIFESLVAL